MKTNAKTTSWATIGLGALVTLVARTALSGNIGAGLTGFGLAHVVLGMLDMARPSVKENS